MSQVFKISKEELLSFIRKLYQEACYGYIDLCDSVTESMLGEFLDGRQPVESGILNTSGTWVTGGVQYSGMVRDSYSGTSGPFSSNFVAESGIQVNVTENLGGLPGPPPNGPPPNGPPPNGPPPNGPPYSDNITEGGMWIVTEQQTADIQNTVSPLSDNYQVDLAVPFHITEAPVVREEVFVRSEGSMSEVF